MTFVQRTGYGRKPSPDAAAYLPGDIVAWNLGRGILHIGIISDHKTADGTPLVVHNIGVGAYNVGGVIGRAGSPDVAAGDTGGGGQPALTVRLATLTARLAISG
jgi:hypothetical protein